MLRASTPENIRFIIIDIQQSPTRPTPPVPKTPAQTMTKRIRSENETPEASDSACPVVRTLTFAPPEDGDHDGQTAKPARDNAGNACHGTKHFQLHQPNKTKHDERSSDEMPYRHVVVTKTFINDLDKDTVIMLDIFQAMQENMASATEVCKKIIKDHQVP
ncbi:unnamed protein product [Lactuca saligna]|uniref:Uncharacterized protein n=1 Tax=Lactuca saligna TaxID=75948 RepID=A0AA35YT45_LACSI|nr:unnamed protein product [Lactuca saligna]